MIGIGHKFELIYGWFHRTFLKVSRSLEKLPKTSKPISCCALMMMIGSIFCTLDGNKYHLNWPIMKSISSNSLLNLPASSHVTKTSPNAQENSTNGTTNTSKLFVPICDWNPDKRNANVTIHIDVNISKTLNYFSVEDEHCAADCNDGPSEKHHKYGLSHIRTEMQHTENGNSKWNQRNVESSQSMQYSTQFPPNESGPFRIVALKKCRAVFLV